MTESDGLTPAQRLGTSDPGMLRAGIVTVYELETLYACVAYENQHEQRVPVLRRLARRASEVREGKEK
ncbi:hypothetical protein [Halomarina ordinaria]|uniref:DUF8129 domain-containing protein n=1 Tax=Halomarina ordinaria TaxID=3033939 RepID=A0ABD5UEV2_9EURY|nr:hypothetical protein [Halomarina sp. PSRA2]